MSTDPKSLSETLQQTLGSQLRSIILYGSSVAGDFIEKRSDHNILVVVEKLDLATLKLLREPFAKWVKSGQRSPLLFTEKRLQQSADVFPVELFDIRDQRRVLFGEDIIEKLELTTANLRLQLESELKGKLIALREGYFACDGKPKALGELVVASLSNFQVLMRAALRLHGLDTPKQKNEVIDVLAARINFDTEPFKQAAQLKAGSLSPKSIDLESLYARYLAAVEQVVDAIDAHEV